MASSLRVPERHRRRRLELGSVRRPRAVPPAPTPLVDAPGVEASGIAARNRTAQSIGLGLTMAGVLLALFAGYLFGWSNLQASREQRQLLALYEGNPRLSQPGSAQLQAFAGRTPADGSLVAVLAVPALGLRQAVVEGTSSGDLQSGPGLMPSTAVPGTRGNAVIAGRHGTFGAPFAQLRQLHPHDQITVTDYLGTSHYTVSSVSQLSGRSLHVAPTTRPLLTLVTSATSFPPSGLVVVHAALDGTPHPTALSSAPGTSSELALGGDPSAGWQVLGWGELLVAALVLTVAAFRRAGRPLLVYLLSTPVVLVAALFTFENLAKLLPGSM